MVSIRRPRYSVTSPAPDGSTAPIADTPLLSRRQLAAHLNICERHTYELEAKGLLRVELGRAVRFSPQDVAVFVARCTRRKNEPSATSAERCSPSAQLDSSVNGRIRGRESVTSANLDFSVALAPRLAAQAADKVRRCGGRK